MIFVEKKILLSFFNDNFGANFGATTIKPPKSTRPIILRSTYQIWKKPVERIWHWTCAIQNHLLENIGGNSVGSAISSLMANI